MADHAVLRILNLQPEAEFPTFRFWVHLDTSQVAESGLPHPAFVESFDFGTAPPTKGADSLSGDQLQAALDEAIAARKADLMRTGQLPGRVEVSPADLVKLASRKQP